MRPDEGLLQEMTGLFTAAAVNSAYLGLWKGTWDGQGDVTYAEATARFTKLSGEVTLSDPTLTAETGAILASWAQEEFTIPGETANGYYLALDVGGTKYIHSIERDPNSRDLNNAYRVTARLRRRNVTG